MIKLIFRTPFLVVVILMFLLSGGCKKQPKCGCGKDVIFTLNDAPVKIQYNESTKTIIFSTISNPLSTYYFCNPMQWMDSLKKLNTREYILVSGDVFYECNYLYQSGNYYYQLPPVYQITVTSLREDNYGK